MCVARSRSPALGGLTKRPVRGGTGTRPCPRSPRRCQARITRIASDQADENAARGSRLCRDCDYLRFERLWMAASGAERTFSLRGTVEKGHHQAFALLKTSRACIPRHHRLWIGAALS